MSDLRELYQEVILDHYRTPRNFSVLDGTGTRHAVGHNPLCGDRVTVYLDIGRDDDHQDMVREVTFQGAGCAISTASASLMTEAIRGRSVAEAERLFERFQGMLTGTGTGDPDALGKLAAFAGVREYPVRIKCATLAWHTLRAALANGRDDGDDSDDGDAHDAHETGTSVTTE